MLVYYNGECYDKETLISHLNRVVEQIERVGDNGIAETSQRCCLAKNNRHRNVAQSCGFPSNIQSSIPHYCEGNRYCCGDIAAVDSGITEICEHEKCLNCHHHDQPTTCHHHPDRKCVALRDKPKSQYTINSPCGCCRYCPRNTCLFIPTMRRNNKTVDSKHLPYITFPENKNEKSLVFEGKAETFRANPFVIDENRRRANNCVVSNSCSHKYCNCKKQCNVDCQNVNSIDLCVCDRTNGLQDTCKICHKPRGRFGYLKSNK